MEYWTLNKTIASRNSFKCRECKRYINIGEKIIQRDGRKIRLIYHSSCFTGNADPRSQPHSSFNTGKFPINCFRIEAPLFKF